MPDEPNPTQVQPAAPAAPAPAQPAAPPAPPAAPTTPAVQPIATNIVLTQDEYQAVLKDRTRLAEIDAALAKERLEAQQKEFAALAKQGKLEEAMNMLRQQSEENASILRRQSDERIEAERKEHQRKIDAAAAEQARLENERRATQARAERFALDSAIAQAMAPHALVDGGAEQVVALIRPSMTVEAHGDSFGVRSTSGQSATEFVAAFLNANQHFLKARNPGGGTATPGGTTQTPPAAPAQAPAPAVDDPLPGAPKNLGWDIIRAQKAAAAARVTNVDPRYDPTQAFGLSRIG